MILDLMPHRACCVIDTRPSRVLSVKLSSRGGRANTSRSTKTARRQRPSFWFAAGGRQFCNRLYKAVSPRSGLSETRTKQGVDDLGGLDPRVITIVAAPPPLSSESGLPPW